MKPLADQDHYEVLDLPRDASAEDVERAYQVARATYASDSLALYSVFGDDDAAALRQRMDAAHSVLSSRETRRAYDAWLAGDSSPVALDPPLDSALMAETMALADAPAASAPAPRPLPPLGSLTYAGLDDHEHEPAPDEIDGTQLRRSRLRRGIELEQIAAITKITPTYLRFLEDDRFDDLPAPVYVRGFVVAYLRCLGLDPVKGAAGYMARYEAARSAGKKGRSPALG